MLEAVSFNSELFKILDDIKSIKDIDDVSDIMLNLSGVLGISKIFMYQYIGHNKAKIISMESTYIQSCKAGDVICVEKQLNICNSLMIDDFKHIPIPNLGEHFVFPIGYDYFIAIEDNEDNIKSNHFFEIFLQIFTLSIYTSIQMLYLIENNSKDPLTQIYHRGILDDILINNSYPHKKLLDKKITGISFIDIDNFGLFNKLYGHNVGDKVLQEVADILQDTLEKNNGMVFRYGGEEFVAIIFDDNEFFDILLENIREKINSHKIFIRGKQYETTVSIGYSVQCEKELKEYTAMLDESNIALRFAKESGRNNVKLFA